MPTSKINAVGFRNSVPSSSYITIYIWCHLAALLRDPEVGGLLESSNGPDDAQALIALTEDLHKLVLAKQLMQQTLIYARYGLRALPENKKEGDER